MKTLDEMIEKYEGLVEEYQHILSEGMHTFLSIDLEANKMECQQIADWLKELKLLKKENDLIEESLQEAVKEALPHWEEMRKATEEEQKSTSDYIESISKPTGITLDEIYDEIDIPITHRRVKIHLLTSEDCVSRKAVLDLAYDPYFGVENVIDAERVEKLPSVQPVRIKGKWIQQYNSDRAEWLECNECGFEVGARQFFNYCPNCGADMRSTATLDEEE